MSSTQAVADAPCEHRQIISEDFEAVCIRGKLSIDGQGHLPHKDCGGTGLRWPELSVLCPFCVGEAVGEKGEGLCEDCDDKGRLPDVTLEKVLDAAKVEGRNRYVMIISALLGCWVDDEPYLDAACAALLEGTG